MWKLRGVIVISIGGISPVVDRSSTFDVGAFSAGGSV